MTGIIIANLGSLGGLFSAPTVRPSFAEEYGIENDQQAEEVVNPLAEAIQAEHDALLADAVARLERLPAVEMYPAWRRKAAVVMEGCIESLIDELEEEAHGSQAPQEPVAPPRPLAAPRWDGADSPAVTTQSDGPRSAERPQEA